jgi:hypothetical protein
MRCIHCRADFCWACMRLRTNCMAFECKNGAPYRDAVRWVGTGGGNGGDRRSAPQADDSILTVIDYLSDRSYPQIHYRDGFLLFGCVVLRRWLPLVDLASASLQIVLGLFKSNIVMGLVACFLLGRMGREYRPLTQPHQGSPQVQHQQIVAGPVRPPNILWHARWLEQQMVDEALRRSLEER